VEYASPKGKRLLANAPGPIGPAGPSREVTACEARWADMGRVGPSRPDPGKNSNGNLILNFK
jgi:hypothetical protein